jgi:GNAT superfamily N-acetyltransferase
MTDQRAGSIEARDRELETEPFQLRDGRWVLLRPVLPEDAQRLTRLCDRISPESSRLRFFRAGRRLTAREAFDLATIDRRRNEAVVALDGDEVVAWGSLSQLGDDPHAEVTLLVDDAYQGSGLGRRLLERLIDEARARNYRMLLAELVPDNERMLQLLESAGVPALADTYFGVLRVHLFLHRDAL